MIFRNTPQWFIAMDKPIPEIGGTLREKALAAIDATRFVPRAGYNRLRSMIETRPDWNVSRQRAWGVPIAVFVDKTTGEPLRDAEVMGRIVEAFQHRGRRRLVREPARALPRQQVRRRRLRAGDRHPRRLVRIRAARTPSRSKATTELKWPADLYLEGSDQHRGWFHSSLLESCGTRGRAPYDGVLTHGFTLDEQGRKMSKSLGNITAPQTVCDQYGADILRLWVVGTDYTEDQRIGPEILKHQAEAYRRLRNTLRYLLGSLDGYSSAETVSHAEMPELERWVLHRLAELDAMLRRAVDDYDFHTIATELHNFCAVDLSAFYFDIRKDAIYCDAAGTPRRRAARTVMAEVFSFLTAWLAPITCFTAEEAWLARPNDMPDGKAESVHLRLYPDHPRAHGSMRRWARSGRPCARCAASSPARWNWSAPRSVSARACRPRRTSMPRRNIEALEGLDLSEICITSGGDLVEGRGAVPAGAFTPAGRGRRRRRAERGRRRPSAHAAGRCWRRSASRPPIRCSASAAKEAVCQAADETHRTRQAMVLLVVTLVADQVSKQLLLGFLLQGRRHRAGDRRFLPAGDRVEPGRSASACWAATRRCRPGFFPASAIAVCIGLFIWLRRTDRPLTGWGIGLVMGGAIGNVIDRARWGAVFDFADFHIGRWHWPAFNVADAAIVVGVGLMLVDSLLVEKKQAP